jgi:hypothetical protein
MKIPIVNAISFTFLRLTMKLLRASFALSTAPDPGLFDHGLAGSSGRPKTHPHDPDGLWRMGNWRVALVFTEEYAGS